tara:strand:+ start:209 stop:436 length:228 start_codon:yes stop_codon:yes gene_type:complete
MGKTTVIQTIPEAHTKMKIPNCPSCAKRGIKRNDCDYTESKESKILFTRQRNYFVKSYAYYCGHYKNVVSEIRGK